MQWFSTNDFCIITKENSSNDNDENMHDLDIYISDYKSKNKTVDTFKSVVSLILIHSEQNDWNQLAMSLNTHPSKALDCHTAFEEFVQLVYYYSNFKSAEPHAWIRQVIA